MAKRIDALVAQRILGRGAQLVDVLPASIFVQEHLPGARSIPLETMNAAAVADVRRDESVVVYCFDQHRDLSARAACRLEQLGFTGVSDVIGGRAAWTVLGLPTEGQIGDRRRVSAFVLPAPSAACSSVW